MSLVRNIEQLSPRPESWQGAVDIGYLTESERDAILDVLWRDERIRENEKVRVSKLKKELRTVRRKGAKRAENAYSNRTCARCNEKMGLIFNTSSQCPLCNHKVCHDCRITGHGSSWKCVVCYKELQLKAETGEWFYGIMRPELRSMEDGTTLVKQAVISKPLHFHQRADSESSAVSTPAITYTPASSDSLLSINKDHDHRSSFNSGHTGSSTESNKHNNRTSKLGPAETGSINSLKARSPNYRRSYSGSSEVSTTSSQKEMRLSEPATPTRSKSPSRMRLFDLADMAHKLKKSKPASPSLSRSSSAQDDSQTKEHSPASYLAAGRVAETEYDGVREEKFSDKASVSSTESKSIENAFEEYYSSRPDGDDAVSRKQSTLTVESYRSEGPKENIEEHCECIECDDLVPSLPKPLVRSSKRSVRMNYKLLEQRRLSASQPNIYPSPKSKMSIKMGSQTLGDNASLQMSIHRDLATSVPDLTKSTMSLGSMQLHDLSITGEIRFSLKFNYKTNILLVNIVECRNLATADRRRKRSDPYVKCYLLPERKNKQKTDVKKKTVCPVYNKCLKFSVSHSELSTRVLELSVWHAGTFTRNMFLGQIQLPLDTWDWDGTNEHWFPLRQREAIKAEYVKETMYKGDLIVALRHVPSSMLSPGKRKAPFGELHVLIKEAKNLTPVRSNGTVDGYVKIMMHPDKQFRQKTSVISKSSNPQWNTNIRMQLYQPMDESGLQLTIYHRDKLQGSTFLGGVRLNLGPSVERSQSWMDATNAEMELWDAAIASPDSWVDGSIPLRPTM